MAGMPILAVGADPAWRARMRRLFALRAELQWLGSYASGEARRGTAQPPALLLLDGDDPRIERERRRPNLPAPIRLYFFREPDASALQDCLRRGATGCLDKGMAADALLRAVAAAGAGLFVMAPALLLDVLGGASASPATPADTVNAPGPRWYGLTERQRQIVDGVAEGLTNKEIARRLQISPETVKTHLQHVFEHEGVHGRMALLAAVPR